MTDEECDKLIDATVRPWTSAGMRAMIRAACRLENEEAARLCDDPANIIRETEPCTAMDHDEDCHGKDAAAIRARWKDR